MLRRIVPLPLLLLKLKLLPLLKLPPPMKRNKKLRQRAVVQCPAPRAERERTLPDFSPLRLLQSCSR
jgi:hypothetical protein